MHSNLFTSSPSVQSSRILYTPSPFARSSLLHLQEVGSLTAIKPHISKREKLQSYLCFMVKDGEGKLFYEGKRYDLKTGYVVFIDCRKAYSHSTGNIQELCDSHSIGKMNGVGNALGCNRYNDGSSSSDDHSTRGEVSEKLWSLRWCHFYGSSMPVIYAKYCERGGLTVIHGADVAQYASTLTDIYALASSDYIRDIRINGKLNDLLTFLL